MLALAEIVSEPAAREKPLTATDSYDWDAGFTLKIPGFYRAEPAVKEAELVVRSKR